MDRLVTKGPQLQGLDEFRDAPTVTLARLVEDPALRGIEVLAGVGGLSWTVDAVAMVTGDIQDFSPRTLYFLQKDDIAETATVDVVLRRAAAASAAGVLVRRSGASRARRAALPTATLLLEGPWPPCSGPRRGGGWTWTPCDAPFSPSSAPFGPRAT